MQDPDFIIVGAGSAGCVLAERLSASGRHRVLVLEAGGSDRRFFVHMPLGYGKTFFDRAVNWAYETEPDPGFNGRPDYWPRGKMLGGSSSINAMVWIRGLAEDYDAWRDAGNPGWGFADMLPAFRAIETATVGSDAARGRAGPLHVMKPDRTIHPLTRLWLKSGAALGLPELEDFNSGEMEGVGVYELSVHRGRRMSAARAFLAPAMKRKNVSVVTGAHVLRINFDGIRAVGVTYRRNGRDVSVRAGREVILAGGAVNTPQLLQLSGVGPAGLLKEHGIGVVLANDNVGAHLQDHVGINYTYRARQPTLNQVLRPFHGKLRAGIEYLLMRTGPLSASLNQGGGFFRTDPDEVLPNMQLYFQALSTVIPKVGERPLLTPDPWPGFSIGLSNCRPRSRGEIAIRSADPFAAPRIVANALSHPDDVADMLAACKFIRRMAGTAPLSGEIVEELLPGPKVVADDEIIRDFRERCGTVYHPVSTCRMGPDPANSVVDPRLRVHGLSGLRVVDCSIFPTMITGNTNAPAIATGWRGAEIILSEIN